MISLKKASLKIAIALSLLPLPLAAHAFGQAPASTIPKGCSKGAPLAAPWCSGQSYQFVSRCNAPTNGSWLWGCAYTAFAAQPPQGLKKTMSVCKATGGEGEHIIKSSEAQYFLCRYPLSLR